MITTHNKISYFGFNFYWKSTYNWNHLWKDFQSCFNKYSQNNLFRKFAPYWSPMPTFKYDSTELKYCKVISDSTYREQFLYKNSFQNEIFRKYPYFCPSFLHFYSNLGWIQEQDFYLIELAVADQTSMKIWPKNLNL